MTDETRELVRWSLQLSDLDLKFIHWAGVKHQAADGLSPSATNGMDEYPIDDCVLVSTITEVPPEGEESKFGSEIWRSRSGNDGIDTRKPCKPVVLKVSNGPSKERPLTASELVTEQVNDHYFRKITGTVDKPGSVSL